MERWGGRERVGKGKGLGEEDVEGWKVELGMNDLFDRKKKELIIGITS